MAAEKLYYKDSHQKTCTGLVTGCEPGKKGYLVTLSETVFYPEGGGQPGDRGTLGGRQVLDTFPEGEEVIHLCDGPLEPGTRAEGRIDWTRRFDLMQQHSGEHMVSGVVYKRYGFHNVGFHMGADVITIDFDGVIPPEDLGEIEQEVNGFIWKNLPLRCWVPGREELPRVAYRRKKDLPWPVRIVEIPGVDSCACCGVQVKSTGEIGLVKLLSCVKFHEGVRIELVCGGRAAGLLSRIYEENRRVSQLLSVKPLETGDGADRLVRQLAREKFRQTGLWQELLALRAEAYAGKENPVILAENLSPAQVRELADAVARRCRGAATVLSEEEGKGCSICIVTADQTLDVRPLGQKAARALEGRGGGKPGAYQGSLRAGRAEICRYFSLS